MVEIDVKYGTLFLTGDYSMILIQCYYLVSKILETKKFPKRISQGYKSPEKVFQDYKSSQEKCFRKPPVKIYFRTLGPLTGLDS